MTTPQHALMIPEPETNDAATLTAPRAWAAELAQMGAGSALLVSATLGASASFVLAAAIASAVIGAALGVLAPVLLSRRVRTKPVVLLIGAGAGLGANWGAASGALAALATGELSWVRAAELGATTGLVVMGAYWLPALLLRARGRSTRVARVATLALCPAIAGYLWLAWALG